MYIMMIADKGVSPLDLLCDEKSPSSLACQNLLFGQPASDCAQDLDIWCDSIVETRGVDENHRFSVIRMITSDCLNIRRA